VEWLRFSDLDRHYGAKNVFAGLSGVVRDREKIGIVGGNGAGKSSLLRILAGIDEPDGGTIVRARGMRAGYVAQDAIGDDAVSLRSVLEEAFTRVAADESRVRALEAELSRAADAGDAGAEERILKAYGIAREEYDRHGGASLERKMRSMLSAFGFTEADLDREAGSFSGGQRTRAALARVLLEEPDVLLLDEPTNHLDVESVLWLEDFLVDDPRACVLVSHDRYVLERVCTQIWEIENGALAVYETPQGRAYTAYRAEKDERREQARREYEAAMTEDRRRRAVIAELRTHGSHNYAQVRSREKQLARLAPVEAPVSEKAQISVRLDAVRRASNGFALTAKDIAKAYDVPVLRDVSLQLARGERLAVVGENGSGKSTLLRILEGVLPADTGTVRVMDGVRLAALAQDAGEELPPGSRAIDAVLDAAPILEEQARGLLGRMNLGGEAADKRVDALSGGERRRVMLARLMAQNHDCLLLDEPTNDLDIPSRDALETVLDGYGGAFVVVSHDRYLLSRVADRVLWLRDGTAMLFDTYDAYERSRRGEPPREDPVVADRKQKAQAAASTERDERLRKAKLGREVAAAEAEVARLDRRKAEIQLEFADPAVYDDRANVMRLDEELRALETAAGTALAKWERLLELHEAAAI
jgi:ATP-binding cassette subfamily F protein 3